MENLEHQPDYDDLLKPSKMQIFWTIVMWFGLIATLVWATMKALGYIHSPPWQESLPFYALAITLGGGIYKFGQDMGRLKHAVRSMGKDTRAMTHRQNNVGQAVVRMETHMDHIEQDVRLLRTEFREHMTRYHP